MEIEKFKNLIPFLTLLLISSSAIKLITFYKTFGIDIIEYIELSELTFSFMDDIYEYLIMIGGSLIWMFIDDMINSERHNQNSPESLNYSRRKLYRDIIAIFFILFGFSNLLTIFFINWIVYLTLAILTILVYLYYQNKSLKVDTNSKYIHLIPTLLLYVFFKAKFEVNYIIERNSSKPITLVLKDDKTSIVSDSTNHYLGKTNNYTFFYNSKLRNSLVYPNEEIKLIQIGK